MHAPADIAPPHKSACLNGITCLDDIACLDTDAFLLILQSILQGRMGKYSAHAHTWTDSHTFANHTFQHARCTSDDISAICTTFADMFNMPSLTAQSLPLDTEAFGTLAEDMHARWRRGTQTLTFYTSGSTGKPKPCTHPESHLRQELTGIIPLIKERKSALVTVPLHHLYGFTFGLLLPMSLGIPIRLEAPIPTAIAHQMREYDLIIGVPLLYTHLAKLEHVESKKCFLLTGTAPLPPEVFAHFLEKDFQMIEFFGSSEMGVMCRRLQPRIHFTLLPQFTRQVHDNEHSSCAHDRETHEGSAADMPDIVRRTFPDGSVYDFVLQDNLDWKDDRHFLPRGRKDFAVQVGGVNVYPEYVSRVLNEHPAVEESLVRLMRPEEGYHLKAFLILKEGHTPEDTRKSLRAHVKQRLKAEEQPTRFDFGADLPRTPIGKPADW